MGNHHHHLILEYFYHSQKILIGIIGLSVDFILFIFFLFIFFLAALHSMWDLSSQTRDQTLTLWSQSAQS